MNLRAVAAVIAMSWLPVTGIGCIPIPWVYHRTPDIYGVLTRNREPVGGAQVRYSFDGTTTGCVPTEDQTTSSDNGGFYLAGTRSFFHLLVLSGPADVGQKYRLCVDTPDGQHHEKVLDLFWGGPVSIPPDSPASVTVECDLLLPDCFGPPYDPLSDAKVVRGNGPGWYLMKPPLKHPGPDWLPIPGASLARWSRSVTFKTRADCEKERTEEQERWFGKNGEPGKKDSYGGTKQFVDELTAEIVYEECISSEDPRFRQSPKAASSPISSTSSSMPKRE